MKTAIPTQAQYEANEARALATQLERVEAAPISDRKEAAAAFAEALRDPSLIRERCAWLLGGCYGFGACKAAARIQAQKRGNRVAALSQLIAAVEWQCPADFARKAYLALTDTQKARACKAIEKALKTQAAVTH